MNPITIREYAPQDCPADKGPLLQAYLDIWNNDENLKYLGFSMRPFDESIIESFLDTHKTRGVQYFCALNNEGKIIGILNAKRSQIEGFEITGLGIHPQFKRQGIGKKLVEHAIDSAKKESFHAIDVSVFSDNAAMLILTISLGFIPSRIEHNKRADDTDLVVLKKRSNQR